MLSQVERCAAAALALCVPAAADTIVVDDDGGPGIDFTDIPPAVAAASAGDLMLVHPGSYSGFTVGVTLTILGAPGVHVGEMVVDGASGAGPIVLARLEGGPVTLRDCVDVVVLQDLVVGGAWPVSIPSVRIEDCDDVRLRGLTVLAAGDDFSGGGTAVHAARSRVELVESQLDAPGGVPECLSGGPGVCLLADDCTVRFARSSAIGGNGFHDGFCGAPMGSEGADGIRVTGATELLISGGPDDEIAGGHGGGGPNLFGPYGTPVVLAGGSSTRYSGVGFLPGCTFVGGGAVCSPGIETCPGCTAEEAVPPDPTLEVLGDAVPGGTLQFRLHATPGASARIFLGRRALVIPVAGIAEDLLTTRDRVIPLGIVPPGGQLDWSFAVPANLPPGLVFYAQAATVPAASEVRLTHSVPIVIQ